jgi:hypothetical protein
MRLLFDGRLVFVAVLTGLLVIDFSSMGTAREQAGQAALALVTTSPMGYIPFCL